jgi:hypothetical protein
LAHGADRTHVHVASTSKAFGQFLLQQKWLLLCCCCRLLGCCCCVDCVDTVDCLQERDGGDDDNIGDDSSDLGMASMVSSSNAGGKRTGSSPTGAASAAAMSSPVSGSVVVGGGSTISSPLVASAAAAASLGSARKAALKEKIVQMYDVLLRGDDPEASSPSFWAEFFLLRPKTGVLEAEVAKMSAEAIAAPPVRDNLNALFEECVANLGEEHHIKVVYALQTLCGLVRAATKKQSAGSSGFDLINLLVGFDAAENRMQELVSRLNE